MACKHARSFVGVVLCTGLLTGCLGDLAATRTLRIHQLQSTSDKQASFVVDTSQLPPGAVKRYVQKNGDTDPITDIDLDMSQVKIMIVPATRP
jgi:hypothetical protein